jgi:DNA processing protein
LGVDQERVRFALTALADVLSARRINELFLRVDPDHVFSHGKDRIEGLNLPEPASKLLLEPDWSGVEKNLEWCSQAGARLLWRGEAGYPSRLEQLTDPPPWLYRWGEGDLETDSVAIIGTRKPTLYGRQVAGRLAADLARFGLVIISGLARGLDGEAHKATLEAGGITVALLGSGFGHLYPPEHQALAKRIRERGVLLSEYSPRSGPAPWHFVARNRLIAALSQGVVVVEAGEKSGTLLTADFALDLGREVFAVPGPITSPQSVGCHNLLKQGAKLVTKADDVLEELRLELFPANHTALAELELSAEERQLRQLLADEPLALEEVMKRLGWSAPQTLAHLSMLEVKGLLRVFPGPHYLARS